MFDLPPDVPPQYTPVIVAEAPKARGPTKLERTIGVCALVENPIEVLPDGAYSAANSIGPGGAVENYLWIVEKQRFDQMSAKVTTLKNPEYGTLEIDSRGGLKYIPKQKYFGGDRATFLIEADGIKIKAEFYIRVVEVVDERLYEDTQYCPNGEYWKISLNPDAPNRVTIAQLHTTLLIAPYRVSHDKPLEPTR